MLALEYIIKELEILTWLVAPVGTTTKSMAKLILLGASKAGWSSSSAQMFTNQFPEKIKGKNQHTWFLLHRNMKLCASCKEIFPLVNFSKCSRSFLGVQSKCSSCDTQYYNNNKTHILERQQDYKKNNPELIKAQKSLEYSRHKDAYKLRARRYQLAKINRIPIWADLNSIDEFYLNRPKGFHVDHILPLQGKLVSGLHVLSNLQYLTAFDNLSKGNSYEITN